MHTFASRRTVRAAAVALAVTLPCVTLAADADAASRPPARAAAGVKAHGNLVDLPVRGGTATLDTTSLRVTARTDQGAVVELSAAAAQAPGKPGPVTVSGGAARWTYAGTGLTVTARSDQGRLVVTTTSSGSADRTLAWPVTGTDAGASALQLPRGEGLSIPVVDSFWNSAEAQLTDSDIAMESGLSMPLWGYTLGGRGVSYLVPTDIGTTLRATSDHGRLRATATHHFSRAQGTTDYTATFALTDGSPVAPAVDYRAWLQQHGQLGSLRRKIDANPATKKLLGAFHAYLWGDARTADGVRKLRDLGVDRMWLGYDADDKPMDAAAVTAAKKAGYLVGPYDSFANGQDR
ncbi:glycoside hydrolase [Streptomyces sp. NPDC051162]|uniref:glycoside hydrolase n=1 Tax=Streptomyces sp. NPDC051162 TaxID=3154747 RepID=UPI003432730D